MVDAFSVDASGLVQLAVEIGRLADRELVSASIRKAVEQTAKQVKDAWNQRLYNEGHASLTRGSISVTVTEGIYGVGADVGARRGSGRQAGVVRLLENGSIHNAPHGYGNASLTEAIPDFENRIAFAAWAATAEALSHNTTVAPVIVFNRRDYS